MSTVSRSLGLAQLCLLGVAPPRLVELAAQAGFDAVGIRVRPVTDAEPACDLSPGSPLLAETLARLADTGVRVRDVEFLLLDGTDQREAWLPMFEAGAALGADTLTVAVADPEPERVRQTVGQMVRDGAEHGIVPTLEPISYQALRSLPDVVRLAEDTGAQVLVDTLHTARFGGTAEQLRAAAGHVPLVQLCDAPAQAPDDRDGLVAESRSARLPCGEGRLDLVGMLRAVESGRAPGAGPLPVSVEIPNDAERARRGDAAWARHLARTARRLLDAA